MNCAWGDVEEDGGQERSRGALQVRVGQRGVNNPRHGSSANLDSFNRDERGVDRVVRDGIGGGLHVTVPVGGRGQDDRAASLKKGCGDGRRGGSQNRGRREFRGENKVERRRGSSNNNWDSSSVASNEERGAHHHHHHGRPRRDVSTGSAGSWDGLRSTTTSQRSPQQGRGSGGGRGGDAWKAWSPQGGPWMGARGRGNGRGWREEDYHNHNNNNNNNNNNNRRDRDRDGRQAADTRWRRGGGNSSSNAHLSHSTQAADFFQNSRRPTEVYKAYAFHDGGGGGSRPGPPPPKLSPSQSLAGRSTTVPQDAQTNLKDQEAFFPTSREREVVPARAHAAYTEVGPGHEDDVVSSIVGTCPDMCPVREREQRQRLSDLAIFERINGNPTKTSAELAVKKFCRTFSSAGLQASDVRPLRVLWRTLKYLLHMLDRRDCTFEVVHSFLFDRTRAIRQELGMQCIANSQAVTMFEEIVRFHIMSERELREKNAGLGNDADSHLNFQQLSKSLLTLLNLYNVVGVVDGARCRREAEFHCYYILLNLGDREHFKAEPLSLWLRKVHSSVLQAPEFQFARKVLRCYRNDNYSGFFSLAKEATYLQGCLMELYFGKVRRLALQALNHGGYKLHPYPMGDIAKLLLMKESDADELCITHGLKTGFDKSTNVLSLQAKQAPFTHSEKPFRHQSSMINRKRASTFFQEVTAGGFYSTP